MAPTAMAETVYEKLLAWDAAGAADLLAKDPELWGQAPAARRLSVHFRKDVAWMLGDVAATPLSVAVRLTRKEDRKQGTDMVRALLEVFKVSLACWESGSFQPRLMNCRLEPTGELLETPSFPCCHNSAARGHVFWAR